MSPIVVDLLLRTGNFSTDSDRAAKALEKLGKQAAAVSAGIDKQVSSLQFQADTFGKSTRETTLYELALKGASAQQLKSAESALAQVEAQEKLAAAGRLAVTAVVAIGAAAIAAAVAIDKLINYAGSFQDLSDETGASAVDLASLAVAAGQAGVSMESVSSATNRLTKGLVGVDEESSQVRAGLTALNINLADFKKLDPVAQYEAVGKALGNFADGAGKTAVAQQILGKAGAEQLKVFKALEDQGGRTNILTAQQIALADQFSDRQAKNAATLKLYAAAVATQFIEPSNALIKVAGDVIKQLLDLGQSTDDLAKNTGIKTFAEDVGRNLAKVADYIHTSIREFSGLLDFVESYGKISAQLLSLDISGARQTGAEFRERHGLDAKGFGKAGADAGKSFVQQYDEQLALQAALPGFAKTANSFGKSQPELKAKPPPKTGAAALKDDPTKKLLDNQLKAISDAIRQEQELLSDRNKFLNLYNDQGLISIRDYYDAQRTILEEATTDQSKEYDKQIALLKAFQANTPKEKDKADAQGKINDIQEKQAKLQQDAGQKGLELSIAQTSAQKRLAQEYDSVNAQVLELQGNLSAAAAIKFDQSFDKLKTSFTTEGKAASARSDPAAAAAAAQGLEAIKALRQQAIAQADLNKLTRDFSLIQGDLSIAEDRIAIKQQTGAIGELDALSKIGDARKAAIVQLQAQIDAFDKLDIASKTPEQIQAIERLRLELEKLQAVADPLALKFNATFEDAFGNSFADFITGAKSAKQAADDFFKSIASEIAKMASKDIAKSIFGGDGGIGGLLSKGISGADGSSSIGGFAKAALNSVGIGGGIVGLNQKNGQGINVAASGFNAARDGLVPTAGATSPITAANAIDTTSITASFTSLQTTGLDPATASLSKFQQAVDAASTAVGPKVPSPADTGSGLTTGDFTRTDHGDLTGTTTGNTFNSVSDSQIKATESTNAFGASAQNAALGVLGLAQSASKGNTALSLLPTIIALVQSSATASAASSVGKGLGSWFSGLFGGGASSGGIAGNDISLAFDGGGYTGNVGVKQEAGVVHGQEYVFSAPAVKAIGVGRLDHLHKDAKAGLVGYAEGGYVNPRRIRPSTAGLIYRSPTEPASAAGGVSVTNHFAITGPVDRRTQQQIAAAAGRSVRDATARGPA